MQSDPRSGIPGARSLAAQVLVRVWDAEAFAAPALDAELKSHPQLDRRDVALATELVYGVLRTEAALESRLSGFTSKGRSVGDSRARAHLLIGAYTLLFLDRIPAFAAVSEAVDGARAASGDRVAAFVNAVLRRLGTELEAHGRPPLSQAIVAAAPGWLRGALRRSLGRAGAEAYLAAGPVPPPIGLCVAVAEDRDRWIGALREVAKGASVEPGPVSPRAILVRGAGDVRRLPGAGQAWIVQEEGAQMVTLAAGARPGERVLDACAGHGNKAWLLGQAVGPEGAVDAADLHPFKLQQLAAGAVAPFVRRTYAVDWTVGPGDVPGDYDRALIDAPCSGVGTLRRRPEIVRGRTPDDVARLADLQVAITRMGAGRVRDGGRLVYAVCSVLREECEEVVACLLAPVEGAARLEPAPFDGDPAATLAAGATSLRILPHREGTDGYFVASFFVRR